MSDGMHLRKVVDECDDIGYRQSDNKMLGNPPISRPYAIIEYLENSMLIIIINISLYILTL